MPFPIILVAANDEKMTPFSHHFHEYRASKPLCLGPDIAMVATDTPTHQAQLQHYFAQKNLAIEVFLFS
ncbi:hypothetical protein Lrub_1095 [Legionella rubrilucens]|uniref:Uncharacterized protein n=1 Tax=Legionella rubrilucens TaxID=458 RepID=A0A0W0XVI3_9GAMM|nr:hypothetical protein [Legionella rubrilucens]KTD48744.1 hypothetical protein Lrub_1095 [Legionella rubrilucens]